MNTHGCIRIADNDIKEIKTITDKLEKDDPIEKKGFLTVTDDLATPVKYSDKPTNAGQEVPLNKDKGKLDLWSFPEEVAEPDNTRAEPSKVQPKAVYPTKLI